MTLEEIRDVLRVVRDYYSNEPEIFSMKNLSKDSNHAKFYKILAETKITKDEEAAASIYGTSLIDSKYSFLKSNFTSRLLNSITFLDFEEDDISAYTLASYKAYKNLFHVEFLMKMGRRKSAISLAKKTLTLADNYELYYVSFGLLKNLRADALQKGDVRLYEKYTALQEEALAFLSSEQRVSTLDHRIRIHNAYSLAIDPSLQEQAAAAIDKIKSELEKYDTYINRSTFHRLQYMYYQLTGNVGKSILACQEGIAYFKEKPDMTPKSRLGEFHLFLLENYILLRDYENGNLAALACKEYFARDSNNWFKYKGYEFILLMQTTRFSEAAEVLSEVTAHERYQSQDEHIKERWNIFGSYIDYVLHTEETRRKKFHFLSKDKRGFNAAIIILEILLLLETDNKKEIIKRIDAIKKYRLRNLKNEITSRQTHILFELIELMEKHGFSLSKITVNSQLLEQKLSKTKPTIFEITECVQIIAIEWVWDKIKSLLK